MKPCLREGRIGKREIHICYFCGVKITQNERRCRDCNSLICPECNRCTCSSDKLMSLREEFCCNKVNFRRGIAESPPFAPYFKAALDYCRKVERII